MCGICGKLSWTSRPDRAEIIRMRERLSHRGPDATGIYLDDYIGLGHTRLSIIDLSSQGNQPMTEESGRFHIVYNGEIYNYRQVRSELEAQGATFLSATDTEVILQAYAIWGKHGLSKLNGMFAFAIWDAQEKNLFLARDRLGEKPLYYLPLSDGGVAFASELKALVELSQLRRNLNLRALSHYLSFGYTLTTESIIQDVKKLEPGHYLCCSRDGKTEKKQYWNLAESVLRPKIALSDEDASEHLSSLLDDAVRIRLMSDVPLGSFLSGGIDSSAVCEAMARFLTPSRVQTFGVGFVEPTFSELPEAQVAASALGVVHRAKVITEDVMQMLTQVVRAADEPFADTSMIPMYFLAQFCRPHVTVCLSGDGSDEIFGGYPTYIADKLNQIFGRLPAPCTAAFKKLIHYLVPVTHHKVGIDYKLRAFANGVSTDFLEAHCSWRTLFSDHEKALLLKEPFRQQLLDFSVLDAIRYYDNEVSEAHYLDRAMYVDVKTWLADDILVKVDRLTMAHSLEARPPFLDYRLVEFAFGLSPKQKIKGLQSKYILKKALSSKLPRSIIQRKKSGFNAPVSLWFKKSPQLVSNLLLATPLPYFNQAYIERLLCEHGKGTFDHGHKLFALVCFQLWHQAYIDNYSSDELSKHAFGHNSCL